MEAQLAHGLNLALDWFNSVPGHWYYTIGVVVASLPLTVVVLQLVKRLHLKVTATEMTNHLIDFVLVVTSFLMAAADFIITNGQNLKYLPQFLLVVVPTIKALAPSVYTYSKAIHSWFITRQSETQSQRVHDTISLASKLVANPPTSSMGTAAAGVTVPTDQPAQNLLQL